jgi:hypothetical protein
MFIPGMGEAGLGKKAAREEKMHPFVTKQRVREIIKFFL